MVSSHISEVHRNQYVDNCVSHLEVNVNMVSQDIHSEKLAATDLTGVLLVSVG